MKERNSTLRYFIVKALVYTCIFGYSSLCFAQEARVSYEELRQKYVPQSSPEETYRLELEMMSEGMYCYDLPIFDSKWRTKGKQVLYSSAYKNIEKWKSGFQSYIEGDYAVVYYPNDKSAGPVFLYRDYSGWVLDRTTVIEKIHYNGTWHAYEGSYPYLSLLKRVFNMKKGRAGGIEAYQIE